MNSTEEPRRRPRWPLITAFTVPPVIFAVVLTAAFGGANTNGSDLWVGATEFGPTSKAPEGAVQVIHVALHDIGAQCLKPRPALREIASDVDLIIAFSQQYPAGRFPIDDETATASSLLLVTIEAVKACSSGAGSSEGFAPMTSSLPLVKKTLRPALPVGYRPSRPSRRSGVLALTHELATRGPAPARAVRDARPSPITTRRRARRLGRTYDALRPSGRRQIGGHLKECRADPKSGGELLVVAGQRLRTSPLATTPSPGFGEAPNLDGTFGPVQTFDLGPV